jgi:hypothetical protein
VVGLLLQFSVASPYLCIKCLGQFADDCSLLAESRNVLISGQYLRVMQSVLTCLPRLRVLSFALVISANLLILV